MMAKPLIQINLTSWKKVEKEISKLAEDLQPAAQNAFGNAALKVVQFYPPYRYVTRKAAYPPTGWQSEKQRRYVMARIAEGRIDPGYPHRTGRIQRGWRFTGKALVNSEAGAEWVMGEKKQANQPRLVGWKKATALIREKWTIIVKDVDKAIELEIKKRNLA